MHQFVLVLLRGYRTFSLLLEPMAMDCLMSHASGNSMGQDGTAIDTAAAAVGNLETLPQYWRS